MTTTKETKKAANQALAAQLRTLVEAGKTDEALALTAGKGASWQQLVTDHADRLKAREAKKAAKAATAKAEQAPVCVDPECFGEGMPLTADSPASCSAPVPAVDPAVLALLAALPAEQAAAIVAVLASPVDTAAPVAAAVSTPSAFLLRDPAAPLKGFAFLVAGKVGKLVKAGDAAAIVAAKREATQCAKWCDEAAKAESDKAERDRLTKKAAIFRKAVATLKAA